MAVDTGSANIVPTITINDAGTIDDKPAPQSPQSPPVSMPGTMPTAPAPSIPDWFKIGWREVGGIDNMSRDSTEEKEKTALEMLIKEQYYGEWYHNAAIIVFVCFFASSSDS